MDNNTRIESSQRIKHCWKCGMHKTITEFGKNKSNSDGMQSRCKECDKQLAKQYRENNKEKVREKAKLKYHENADHYKQQFCEYGKNNAEKIKKRKKEHYEDHKDVKLQIQKDYYEKNKEKVLEYQKQYRKENREVILLNLRMYYVQNKDTLKKKQAEWYRSEEGREKTYQNNLKRRSYKHHVRFYGVKRKNILNRDDWTCQNCGCKVHDRTTGDWNTPDKAHIDHVIPISKGGNSEPSNLQVLCRTCNLSKQDKTEMQLSFF